MGAEHNEKETGRIAKRFAGKVAIITEAAKGMGQATVTQMSCKGQSGNDSPSLLLRFLTVEEVAKTVIFTTYNDGINRSSIWIDAGVTRVI